MNRYDYTREAKLLAAVRNVAFLVAIGLVPFWFFSKAFETCAPEEITEIGIAAVVWGFLCLLFTIVVGVDVVQIFRGSREIVFDGDWIVLPGLGRIEVGEIEDVKKQFTILHPKVTITLKRRFGPFSKVKEFVFPHNYGYETDIQERLLGLSPPLK
ncbi:MAG: hypothetical protein K8R59_01620 [Thermoanaerobaculales bacterium]|nr:hypothetical protein [Thermoanaerobaculales bacterium]